MGHFRLRLQNDLDEIETLMDSLDAYAEEQELPGPCAYRLSLILEELITNTISYGFPDERSSLVDLKLERTATHVLIVISDQGIAFDPLVEADEPDVEAEMDDREIGGLGVHFVREFTDKAEYERRGDTNILSLALRLGDE